MSASSNSAAATTDVSILVVAYNSQDIISACLESIPDNCPGYTHEVLLIDNGDGSTADLVAAKFPHVQIVPSQGNVGFAAGNNLLAAEARGRYFLLLNPDVMLEPEALCNLMQGTVDHPSASAWGGVTLGRDGRPDLGNTVHVPSLREMASRTLGRSVAATSKLVGVDNDAQVGVLSGSFVMFTRDAWDDVGGLDDRYFLYCEEVDLFYRLARRGHTFWRIAKSLAYHDIGHGDASSPMRGLYLNAGVMQFVKLHWSQPSQRLAFALIWFSSFERFLAGRLLGWCNQKLKSTGKKERFVALRPNYWRHGYDSKRGLLARLRK